MTNITDALILGMRERSAHWGLIGEASSPDAFLERIYLLYLKRNWNEAIQSCDFIIKISIRQSNSLMRAAAHFYKGIILHDWRKWEPAREAYSRAGDLFWLLGNPCRHEYALTKWALAALKQAIDEYDEALHDYIEAATVFRQLRLKSSDRAEPVSAANRYQEMIEQLEKSISHVQDISRLEPPLAHTFPITQKIPPLHDLPHPIVYYRENHSFTIRGKRAQAMPTSPDSSWMDPSWVDFDLQLDRHAPYYAIQAESSMVGIAGINKNDYLLVCLVKDNQLSRRKDNPNALGLVQERDGLYRLAPKVIGGSHRDLYAYVDVILKEQS